MPEFMNPVRDFFGVGPEAQKQFYDKGLASPKGAAWGQALNNISRMNMGGMPQQDPISAYQQTVQQNALMNQRRQQFAHQQQMADWQKEYQSGSLAAQMAKAGKPSAGREKLNMYMTSIGLDPQDPTAMTDPRVSDFLSSSGINIDVNTGNPLGDMAGIDSKKAQDAFRDTLTGLPGMVRLKQDFNPEFFTTMGQLGQKFNARLDRINPESLNDDEKMQLRDFTQYANRVKQEFNNYRRLITGAAASEQEMKDLEESLFNLGQGPTAFEASLDARIEDISRDLRGAIYLQSKGVAEMGTPEMAKALNKRAGANFTGDQYKTEVFNYVASAMGFDPEDMGRDQALEIAQYLKTLGFKGK